MTVRAAPAPRRSRAGARARTGAPSRGSGSAGGRARCGRRRRATCRRAASAGRAPRTRRRSPRRPRSRPRATSHRRRRRARRRNACSCAASIVVAPLDGRAQRLLARQRGPAAAGEQAEAVVELGQDLLDPQHAGARRRQLERQRDAVEPPADLGDGRRVGVGERELGRDLAGALDEEPHRLEALERGRAAAAPRLGQRQRRAPGAPSRRRRRAPRGWSPARVSSAQARRSTVDQRARWARAGARSCRAGAARAGRAGARAGPR